MRFLVLSMMCLGLRALGQTPIPSDWMLPSPTAVTVEDKEAVEARAKAIEVDEMLIRHTKLLDSLTEKGKLSTRGEWSMSALSLDLGLSLQGLLGVVVTKGSVAVTARWLPTAKREVTEADDYVPTVAVASVADARSDRAAVESLTQAIVATGEVKDSTKLRAGLDGALNRFRQATGDIVLNPGASWQLAKLRLDFSVDGSGQVYPGTTVGAALRFRFDWVPAPSSRVSHRAQTAEGESTSKLMRALASEISTLDYSQVKARGFDVNQVKIALGLNAKGKIGVAKAGGEVKGHAVFAQVSNVALHPVQMDEDAEIMVLTDPASSRGPQLIPRDAFHKGLEKAVKIGANIAERAAKADGEHWTLKQIKVEFELALSGSVGLLSVGGSGAVELNLNRTFREVL